MGLPKNYRKKLDILPNKEGIEQRQSLFDEISDNNGYLPKGLLHEDMDSSFVEFVKNDLTLSLNGEEVPVLFLTLQRWNEFAQTWQNSNEYKNIKMPFITIVRKPDPQPGTNQSGIFNIPGKPTFTYMKVPTYDGIKKGMDIYKIPQPVPVDLIYEVRIFCNRMRELNKFNKRILQTFSPLEYYIKSNGHPLPIILDSIGDESVINTLDERKYYVQLFTMKLMGYLLNENDFIVTPGINRNVLMLELKEDIQKPVVTLRKEESDKTGCLTLIFAPNVSSTTIPLDINAIFTTISLNNVANYSLWVNNVPVNVPFTVTQNDNLKITMTKVDTTIDSTLILNCQLI